MAEFASTDYGDAPDTYGTLEASNGARHTEIDDTLYLGAGEADGESDEAAARVVPAGTNAGN